MNKHPFSSPEQQANNLCCLSDIIDAIIFRVVLLIRLTAPLVAALLLTAAPFKGEAQNVQVSLILPPPGSLNPEDLTQIISFNNTGTSSLYLYMMITVEEEDKGLLFNAMSSVFELTPGFSMPEYTVYEPVKIEYVDPVLEEYVIHTNSMPGGEYVICVTLLDVEMGAEVGYHCVSHSVFYPSAPMLVYPADGNIVNEPAPFFSWLPPSPTPPVALFYALHLVKVSDGQFPYEAIQSNLPWLIETGIFSNNYLYPIDAAPLEQGKTYAWQVQSLMADGFPVGENSGYSEIGTFQHWPDIVDGDMITWVSPPDGEEVNQSALLFQWFDPAYEKGLPLSSYYYTLHITRLDEDAYPDMTDAPMPHMLFTNITDPMLIYPSHIPPLTPGNYTAQVFRMHMEGYLPGDLTLADPGDEDFVAVFKPSLPVLHVIPAPQLSVTGSSPLKHFSYTDAMLEACCDTIAVMNKIWGDIDAIKADLCNNKKGLMDQLLDALDIYMDKQWDADNLRGVLDNADVFKQNMDAFRSQAVNGIQAELNQLSDLRNDCNINWRNDFYSRYVANPSVGGSYAAKQQRYNRAANTIQRRFERQIEGRIRDLERRKDQVGSRYDGLIENLDDYINEKQDDLNNAQKETDDALNRVTDLFNQIRDNLCGVDKAWDDLFAFILANFCCITKCAEVHVPVPPEFAEMEDCLRDLFNKLAGWKANIREPNDPDVLQNNANRLFNAGKAMDELRELNDLATELKNATNNFNRNSRHMQIVDNACGILYTYGSGARSTGRLSVPRDNNGMRYGAPGSGKVFAYKSTGAYAPSSRERRDAARERRDFIRQQQAITQRMNLLAWGFNLRPVENGFVDPAALEAHGKVAAAPYHNTTADVFDQLIDHMLDELKKCYDISDHHRQRQRYNNIITECVAFREALRELDKKYADHATKTAEKEAELRNRLAELRRLVEQQKQRASAAGESVEALQKMVDEITNQINELQKEPTHSDKLHEEKAEKLRELRRRLSALRQQLQKARKDKNNADNLLAQLEQLRKDISDAIDDLGKITPPSPIGSADEANEESDKVDQERQEKEDRGRQIDEMIKNAANRISEADTALNELLDHLNESLTEADKANHELRAFLEYLRRLAADRREYELFRRKTDCLRLLEEYKELYDREPGLLGKIWDFFWKSKEELDMFPEGISDDLDQIKSYLNKIEEAKNRILQAMALFNGLNTDDPAERAKAFGEILNIAEEISGIVPGFGEMLSFYARTYNAIMEAIDKIAEQLRRPAKELIDKYVIGCDVDAWLGKSLKDVLEEEWQKFLRTSEADIYVRGRLSSSQQKIMEQYFKDKAASRIYECCVKELLK